MARKGAIILAFAIAIAGAGTAMYMQSIVRTSPRYPGQPIHPITTEMRTASARASLKPAPLFTLPDHAGRMVKLSDVVAKGPALLIFTIHDCPCSIDAQPLFNDLAKYYGSTVTFLGIGHDTQLDASNYVTNMTVPYPLLIDPDKSIIKAFGAVNSVYSVLVGKDGKIERMWPGYDQKMVVEINETIAKASGLAPMKINLSHVPKEPTSGCSL